MKPNILVVGSFVMDLIVTTNRFCNPGETVVGNDFLTAPGGKGANQAIQAARLGANVTLIGMVGNDNFGKEIIQSAKQSNVNTDHVIITLDAPTAIGNVQIQKNENGTENRIIVIPGANFKLKTEDVSFLKDEIQNYDMVILQNEIPQEVNEKVAEYAKAKGIPVMFNPAPASEISQKLISLITYISPNEHEAEYITKINPNTKENLNTALNKLHDLNVENVIITLGKEGCVFSNKESIIMSPSINIAQVVDPTAAGDSFIAAFCTAISSGVSIKDSLTFANYTAGITVSRMGAQTSLPTFDEVMFAMQNNGLDIKTYKKIKGE